MGVEQGIILAIVLSVIVVLAHVYKPHDRVISSRRTAPGALAVDRAGRGGAGPGDLRLRRRALLRQCEPVHGGDPRHRRGRREPPIRWFAIDAAAMADLDYSGADALRQITRRVTEQGARLVLCSVDTPVRTLLDAYGLTD